MTRALTSTVLVLFLTGSALGDTPPPAKPSHPELDQARRQAWTLALVIAEKLNGGEKFPGITAWQKDFQNIAKEIDPAAPADKMPLIDSDALVTRNPNFWQAYYEIAPGDPGLMLLHAALLLAGGEASRASCLLVIGEQRPGVPKAIRMGFDQLLTHTQNVAKKPNAIVQQGVALHDKGDYPGAIKKYREALALWQQHGFAHYEIGFSLYCQDLAAKGQKPEPPGTVTANDKARTQSQAVKAQYAKARQHDPLQLHAYQGDEPAVIEGLMPLAKDGVPAWQTVLKNRPELVEDEVVRRLATAFQDASQHELALAARQVLVARRGRYDPSDYPFIVKSLRALVPGKQTEDVLTRLAGPNFEARQLVVPDRTDTPPTGPKVVELRQLRLYVPQQEFGKRVGAIEPLAAYIKALEKAASASLEKDELPKVTGILVAVGIKPQKKSRVWCQGVGAGLPEAVQQRLEKDLVLVPTVAVSGIVGFAMELKVRGQDGGSFPEFPRVWVEAAKESGTRVVPPDDLFKLIWKE